MLYEVITPLEKGEKMIPLDPPLEKGEKMIPLDPLLEKGGDDPPQPI